MNARTPFFNFVLNQCEPLEFVGYWSEQYDYPDMDMYEGSMIVTPVTEERIRCLFTWKNGMPLSERKKLSLETQIISKIPVIQQLSNQFDQVEFDRHFGKLRTVWRVFLLHIIDPEQFPIFDQHVYRAYRCLLDLSEIATEKEPKVTMVAYEKYRVFFEDLAKQCGNKHKMIDNALWAFGKFLSRYPTMVINIREHSDTPVSRLIRVDN